MKVYIVYIIPDYIGIEILNVFSNKGTALKFMDYYNTYDVFASKYDICKADCFEQEVFDNWISLEYDGVEERKS